MRRGTGSGRREEPEALAIVGPTATGKTALAVAVALELDGEVISVDSRQAYLGMEVGTAAPEPHELAAVPHHGVAFLSPARRYSAGSFARLARGWIGEIRGRGRVPILAGGTGFFLRALLDPVFREPEMDRARREALRRWLGRLSEDRLRAWVDRLDPGLRARLDAVDRQRASRSLELAILSGRPLTEWLDHAEPEADPVRARVFLLELPAEAHRARIAARTERALDGGWIAEARRLRAAGLEEAPALDAVGYREVFRLLDGRLSREEAVRRIDARTWAYARRQRTWFRHQLPGGAVRLDAGKPIRQLARRIVEEWRRHVPDRRAGSGELATGEAR